MSTYMTTTRQPSTTRHGHRFDEATIEAVWNKARIIPGVDPRHHRKDRCGAIIDRSAYGSTVHNGNGWEVDHIVPVAKNGSDDLGNLQPLQWQNNRAKGDSYPSNSGQYCVVAARS